MSFIFHPSTLFILAHGAIIVGIIVRVIYRRPATGVALAWLVMVASLPMAGAIIYFLIGERRIGRQRSGRIAQFLKEFTTVAQVAHGADLTNVDWSIHGPAARGMGRLGVSMAGMPAVRGSSFQLYYDTQMILGALAEDVDSAKKSLLMEFYIWNEGGTADHVLEAVIRAAQRGVKCRLLIDALGARPWWDGQQPQKLLAAGVELRPALPVGMFRTFVGRTDLRVHRKIVVVDGEVAWTGSMNLVDPRFFKQDCGVGEWVDAMVRLRGSVVAPLAATMIGDWIFESGESVTDLEGCAYLHPVEPHGQADMQVIASGPGQTEDGLLQMVLALINSAQQELVITTPYLVPDDSLLRAVRGAGGRGVEVSLIVPAKVDSLLARYASRSYYDDLLSAGVKIYLFQKGLLPTSRGCCDSTLCGR